MVGVKISCICRANFVKPDSNGCKYVWDSLQLQALFREDALHLEGLCIVWEALCQPCVRSLYVEDLLIAWRPRVVITRPLLCLPMQLQRGQF